VAVGDVDADAPRAPARWLDDLALWAQSRSGHVRLQGNVVRLSAPELTGDQLYAAEMAQIGGIAASTLRAYISRGEAGVPLPQATVGGRGLWARPVGEEWAEQRQRSPESVAEAVATERAGASVPPGIAVIWRRFSRTFFAQLWEHPGVRRRWALRWRNEAAVQDIAEELGWEVAADIESLVPLNALAATIRHAVLDELATGQRLDRSIQGRELRVAGPAEAEPSCGFYGIAPSIVEMLDWIIRHDPRIAPSVIGEIVGEAEDRLGIPREVSEKSLRRAIALDSKIDATTQEEFLSRVLSPKH
jgi:hypothetical protein